MSGALGEADDHGVPVEDGGGWNTIKQLACIAHVAVGCCIQGEDAAGDVVEVGEAEGDEAGMDPG